MSRWPDGQVVKPITQCRNAALYASMSGKNFLRPGSRCRVLDQVTQRDDADDRRPKRVHDLLDGASLPGTAFLAVQSDGDARQACTGLLDEAGRLAYRCTRGYDIVQHEHAPTESRSDRKTHFAMVFALFAVEAIGQVDVVFVVQSDRDCRYQRYALVSGSVQHVDFARPASRMLCA